MLKYVDMEKIQYKTLRCPDNQLCYWDGVHRALRWRVCRKKRHRGIATRQCTRNKARSVDSNAVV